MDLTIMIEPNQPLGMVTVRALFVRVIISQLLVQIISPETTSLDLLRGLIEDEVGSVIYGLSASTSFVFLVGRRPKLVFVFVAFSWRYVNVGRI